MPENPPAIQPSVAIVILNWNGIRDTIECMESLFRLDYRPIHIIIVDNGSTDGSVETLRSYLSGTASAGSEPGPGIGMAASPSLVEFTPREALDAPILQSRLRGSQETSLVVLIRNHENAGYARGNNIGIRFALRAFSPEFILVLNHDVILPDPGLLSRLVSSCEGYPRIGVITPVVRSPDGSVQRSCTRSLPAFPDFLLVYSFLGQRVFRENRFWRRHYHYDYAFDAPGEFDVISGAFMLFRNEALREIGLFDEDTFLYWEETIAGRRLKEFGWKSVLDPGGMVIHKGESTIRTFNLKSWARYWSIRSEFVYIAKYARLNILERGLIRATLALEACLGLLLAVLVPVGKQFDARCELRILSFLLFHR